MLRCPAETKRNTQGASYKAIADLLESFIGAGCLPRADNLSRLDDSEGIEATLRQHKAKWHDSCRLQFNKTKLKCAGKRNRSTVDAEYSHSSRFTHQR